MSRLGRRTNDTGPRRFERFLEGQSIGMVKPSPDGQWLAWVTYPEGVLWRGRRDGRDRLPLTSPPRTAFLPAWSPDGKTIAFTGADSPDKPKTSLQLVSSNGGAIEVLSTPERDLGVSDACFMPDGRTLLYSAQVSPLGIYRLDLQTRIVSLFAGAEHLLHPKCGPQGQVLASNMDADGTLMVWWPQQRFWEDLGVHGQIYSTWTRDGRSFCGLANSPVLPPQKTNRIECYSFASRRLELRAEIGDMPLLTWNAAAAVPWMGLDADDTPMVMRDRSTRDIYSLDWEAP